MSDAVNELIEATMADLVAVVRTTEPRMRKAMLLSGSIISKAVLKASADGDDPEVAALDEWKRLYEGNSEVTAEVSSYAIPIAVGILAAIEAQERSEP